MQKLGFWFFLALLTFVFSDTFAATKPNSVPPPLSKEQFCTKAREANYTRRMLFDTSNLLSFKNDGGLFNKGFCWWHSMFTRNAAYLAYFRPDLRRPTETEALNIIEKIREGRTVVAIPGFANLRSFSHAFENLIRETLEDWQIDDGLLDFGFIEGLSGDSEVAGSALKTMMDDLYVRVKLKNHVVYQMLQHPGISSHSWLVIDMKKIDGGYALSVVDSNFTRPKVHQYHFGDTQIGDQVPYTTRNNTISLAQELKQRYCKELSVAGSFRPRSATTSRMQLK